MDTNLKTKQARQQTAFVTPYYECKLKACFQITDQALENLQSEGVPSVVLKKLPSIRNQICFTKREYKNFLKEFPLTEEILKSHIRHFDNKICIDIDKISDTQKKVLGEKTLDKIIKLAEAQKARVKEEFLAVLKATIGNKKTDKYGSLILKHAKISDNKTYLVDVTLSSPPQTKPSPVIDELIGYFSVYKITNKTLNELRSKRLAADILKKLESKKNEKIQEKRKFLNVLKETIGEEQTVEYGPLILEHVERSRKKDFKTICDFGAGKLRNVKPFLKEGFTVFAVDYEKQFRYNASKAMQENLRHHFPRRRFKKLIFPSDFDTKELDLDAVLLIFVNHIIPSPRDRDFIIRICSEKLRRGGLLVWVTPYWDAHMRKLFKPQYRYRDGWILHAETQAERKTFYTEFKVPQIDEMVGKHGLKFIERIDFYKNPARIYEKI